MVYKAGTINGMVQLAELDSRWQQKKENNFRNNEELTAEERQVQFYKEQLEEMREGNKSSEIYTKIKSGAELTLEEIDYLKKNNPDALRLYEEIKKEKEAYKSQLKNCRTKEEVDELRVQKMNSFISEARRISSNPYIPDGEKSGIIDSIMAKVYNIQKAHAEFTKTIMYIGLPDDEKPQDRTHGKTEAEKAEDADRIFTDTRTEDNTASSSAISSAISSADSSSLGDYSGGEERLFDEGHKKKQGIDVSV